jgi:hypothetical protein
MLESRKNPWKKMRRHTSPQTISQHRLLNTALFQNQTLLLRPLLSLLATIFLSFGSQPLGHLFALPSSWWGRKGIRQAWWSW